MTFQVQNIFVNMPVRDLPRAMAFFASVGFTFNRQFTNEMAAAMVINEQIYAMLLTEEHFGKFTKKPIADATQTTEVLIALSVNTRAEVDALVDQAMAAGAVQYGEPMDHGFMYQRSFADLDGHQWEIFFMDPSYVQPTEA